MKNIYKVIAVSAFFALFSLPVHAASFEAGENYSLSTSDVIEENLYIGAGNMAISGTVVGDLIGAGGNVLVTGVIEEDAILAGGTVDILGEVREDLRVTGGKITIGEPIGQDLVVAGGVITVLDKVVVGGDAVIAGGLATVSGTIGKDLELAGGEVVFNGVVNGDVQITAHERLTIGPETVINGDLVYRSIDEVEIPPSAVISGEIQHRPLSGVEAAGSALGAFVGTLFIVKFILLFVSGLVVVLLFRKITTKVVEIALNPFGKSFLTGLIIMIVTPVAAMLLLATLVGLLLGMALWTAFALSLVLAKIYGAIVLGAYIWKFASKDNKATIDWRVALLGVFLTVVISLIPVIGWAINLVFIMVALGAIGQMFNIYVWQRGR